MPPAIFGIPVEFFGVMTPGALLGLVVLFIISGKLVPEKQVNRLLADKDARYNDVKETSEDRKTTIQELLKHNTALLKGAETTLHVVESLPRPEGVNDNLRNQEASQPT
jgi:hypothetical protein